MRPGIGLIVGTFALIATWACTSGAPAQERADLSALVVIDAKGVETTLAERTPDTPAILHFWATWCVPCREELPQVEAFRQTLEPAGLADRLIVVSVDRRAFADVAAFLTQDLALDLETLLVARGNAGATLGLFGYPYTLLLDADRAIAERFPGPIDWTDPDRAAQLRAHID